MDQLHAMRVFCQVVESGGMAAAARVLGLAPASISGTLARLEKHLGVRLLQRSTRTFGMTEAGELWYSHARQIVAHAAAADEAVRRQAVAPAGQLRVTASASVTEHFVYPWLADFCRQYPAIELTLLIDDRVLDLQAQSIDLALRTGKPADSSLVALPLCHYPHQTCASPAYLARRGVPLHPRDLADHACLTYRRQSHWYYEENDQTTSYLVRGHHVSNHSSALRYWALAGEGIMRQPDWVVREDVRQGRLVPVLTDFSARREKNMTPLCAVLPQQGARPRKVERFLVALRAWLAAQSDGDISS